MIIPTILGDIITDQCWKLTAILLSQYDIVDLCHPWHEYWCPFEHFRSRFDDVFPKELIELATLARVTLDADDEFGSKQIVGTLLEKDTESPLDFRQACNKIMHAKNCEVILDWSSNHPLDNGRNGYGEANADRFKNPIIRTKGEYKGTGWQAEIHFLKYVGVLKDKFS